MSETAVVTPSVEDAEKVREIARHMRAIITTLGLDLRDSNLSETPDRIAKMHLEMFHGLLRTRVAAEIVSAAVRAL